MMNNGESRSSPENMDELKESDNSLSLSLTPPIPQDDKQTDESISEHITPHTDSVENDRSYQEIEISNKADETRDALDSSTNSIISLNYLERITHNDNIDSEVRDIIQQLILNVPYACTNSSGDSEEVSLNIFANVDLDDKSLTSRRTDVPKLVPYHFGSVQVNDGLALDRIIKDTEELLPLKDNVCVALAELDSFRELSNTNSSLSKTEYRQIHEDAQSKILDHTIVLKNELIQQLSESLDQSVAERRHLLNQICLFKEEIALLKEKLEETTNMMSGRKYQTPVQEIEVAKNVREIDKEVRDESIDFDIDKAFSDIEANLNDDQKHLLKDLKLHVNLLRERTMSVNDDICVQQLDILKRERQTEKEEYEAEIVRLQGLLANIKCGSTEIMEMKEQLETQHAKEMEELRTYFEKKCADLEKNYSEEIFSQQSRKMSGSTSSEAELNSDVLFSQTPGPAGDISYDLKPKLTRKDIASLQNDLNNLLDMIRKYGDVEKITDHDFEALEKDIAQTNLASVLKIDLSHAKKDMQNKYHAELEILREDGENRTDALNVEYERKLKAVQERYEAQIEELKGQLEELEPRQNVIVSSAVQEVRLASQDLDQEVWPSDLLKLRDRFAEKYEEEIRQLKDEHKMEVERLKEEHLRILNGALERARRRSLREGDSIGKSEMEILRERDNLKKQVTSLRGFLGELVRYFTQCEDELNNTLVDELLRQGLDKSMTQAEDDQNPSSPTSSSRTSENSTVTRVHLTPNFADLINRIETNSQGDSSPLDVSLDLKNELGTCLEKLKQEANAILALTTNVPRTEDAVSKPTETMSEDKIDSLKRQLIDACRSKESFKEQLDEAVRYAEVLERQKDTLEEQLQLAKEAILEKDMVRSGCKEVVVSEGYGQQGSSIAETGDPVETLANLQERARSMLADSRGSADPTLLTLIEDLCSVAEAIKADLLQQIDVADKKYKTTQQFLDDQAVERELERDEAQKKINSLHEQLRERSKDRNSCERAMAEVNCECSNCCTVEAQVEHLEQQLQEMTRSLSEVQQRQKDVETERDEAVEKIKVLRDIIRDLEQQGESTAARLDGYESRVQELQRCLLECQAASGKAHDSTEEVAELYAHIEHLENEVQRLRTYSELVGSEGALTELKRQLSDLDTQLERKTRLLETLHSTGNTNCSSPSEDISVRDIVRSNSQAMEECEVPLQQLARLKERLVKHSRAEDTAIKRIKDLEMEVFGLRNELEEANNERDYMKRQIQEQLVLISDFQIRLDEQRIITERIEKETNTSLEHRLYDMQNEIVSLNDQLETKEKALNHQRTLLQETRAQVRKLEEELTSTKDDEIIVEMQKELEKLRTENAAMKEKIEKDKSIVPNLVENIISDKNTDIEKLRDKLHCAEKLLETYTSLNLDPRELKMLSQLKCDSTTWDRMISSIEMDGPEQARRADYHRHSEDEYTNSAVLMKSSEGTSLEPEISAIEKQVPLKHSNELSHRKVRFLDAEEVERLERQVERLKSELEMKETLTTEYQQRLKLLDDLEKKIEQLQTALDKTEEDLAKATVTFQKEQKEMEEREKDLQIEVAESKFKLTQMSKSIQILEQDSNRKDNVCLNLTREKRELEAALKSARNDNFTSLLSSKDDEISKLHIQLKKQLDELMALKATHENCPKVADVLRREQKDTLREMERLREKLKRKQKETKEHGFVVEKYEREKTNLEEENKRLRKFLQEREAEAAKAMKDAKQCEQEVLLCEQEVLEWRGENEALTTQLKQVLEVVENKDRVIRQMEEDYKTVHANLLEVERKLKEAGNVRDLMAKLKQEQMRSEQFYEQIHDLKIQLLAYKNDPSAPSVDDVTDKVRKELDEAAKIDTSILSAVSDHSLNSLTESWDVEAYRRALVKEKEFVDRLTKQNQQLRGLVAREQEAIKEMKKNERETIAKTKFKLRENQAREARLEEMLEERKKACQRLQGEITALRLAQATPSLHTESTKYKSLPDTATLELNRLKEDLAGTREALATKEREAKSAQDMLTTELLRCKNLHEKTQQLAQVERELRDELARKDVDIERITSERESEKAAFLKQKSCLLEQLKTSAGPGKNQPTVPAPDAMLNHLKQLNAALLDNRKLMIEVQKLVEEKRSLKMELEGIRRRGTNNAHLDEVADRADYLFAKTLRYESVNKALVWQKRYLINYVCAHHRHCTLSTIFNPLAFSHGDRESRNTSPISRFRRAAFVMIAIARMRYMVLRWHSGVRRAEQVNMYHYSQRPRHQEAAALPNTQFQVGQPVSSQVFRGVVPTTLFEDPELNHEGGEAPGASCSRVEAAWSGQSPPSRDTKTAACAIPESNHSRGAEEGQRIPHLLDRCAERISLIQDRIRIMLDENK